MFCAILLATSVSFAQKAPDSPVGAKHVVWIGSDGFGAHYVNWDELPNMKKMKENGAWTLHMRSVLPSSSAINWESQMVGAPSEMHGFRTWCSKEPDVPSIYVNEHGRFPCIFRVLKDAAPDSASTVVYSWDGIGYLYDAQAVKDTKYFADDDEAVYQYAREQLATKPTLAFIYFGEPDHTGHSIGWGSPEYQKALTKIDDYIGKILKDLEDLGILEDTVILFSADHGGTNKGHGDALMEHMETPFLIYGAGVEPGEITDVVVNFDLAPTIAWVLGLEQPQAWRGVPVLSAFQKK